VVDTCRAGDLTDTEWPRGLLSGETPRGVEQRPLGIPRHSYVERNPSRCSLK
jgi:hypothetical protein